MKADLGRSKKVITEMRPVVDNFKKEIYEKKQNDKCQNTDLMAKEIRSLTEKVG